MSGHGRKAVASIRVGEVEVRLARTSEYAKWDRLMRKHHALGFNRFASRGLRYIVEYQGQWAYLLGWQNLTTGRYEPVSKSTLYRIMQHTDPK